MSTNQKAVDVIVRFSSTTTDVMLHIDDTANLSVLSLKQRIREQLPSPAAAARLRLIHAGRVLGDDTALSKSLKFTHAPPRDAETKSTKAKGKQPVRDVVPRIYIHCSIGDALTPAELATEAQAAQEADAALLSETAPSTAPSAHVHRDADGSTTTTPAPRGFDRLLSAGFTASEVTALRAQFLAIQAHSHTPDTMPTGPELLALEERWLDNGSVPAEGDTPGDTGGFGSEDSGGLEDLLYGNLTGFFWPMGAMCWLMREEGVWSRRRQISVLSGFLVNLMFGFLRWVN